MLGFILPLFRWRTLLALLGLLAISALIWFLGPLIMLFGERPLAPESTRAWIIGGMFGVIVLVALFRYWRARRANARMINKLLDSDGLISLTETQSSEEVEILRERFEEALKILKETRIGGGNGLLKDLPWYIIIGPPGSGKTTILRNSGLDFPLAERVGADVLQGVGGTRNCDWWFTDQAVLIDTAGRYTTQDSNAVIDRAAWRSFLDLIKQFRARRPLNGVLLAISLGDILTRDEAQRMEYVDIFRRRLQELMRAFGMRLPVYLLITKCDLMPGFTEFFDNLNDDQREQLWGMTFTPAEADTSLGTTYNAGFSELLGRTVERMQPRLHEERDAARRRLIYAFPQQFGSIRELVGVFVNEVFRPNRYELAPMLRGVFFTSGTQEGTPIDRLLGAFSRSFGLGGTRLAAASGKGRTFFVRQMLTDIVFAEADLVGTNRSLERRLALTHVAGYAAAAVLVALCGLLWFSAYANSRAEAATVEARAQTLLQMRTKPPPVPIAELVTQLDAARDLAHFYDSQGFLSGVVVRVGLSSSVSLAPRTQTVYDRMIARELLPQLVARVRAQLVAAVAREAGAPQLHDLLAIYLMLGDNSHFDRPTIAAWMRADADSTFALDQPRRTALWTHYQALLQRLPSPQPLDATLIASIRQRLLRIPDVDAIYADLRAQAAANPGLPAFTFSQAVGIAADTAFSTAGGTGMHTLVPGLYTRQGFYDGFVARLPALVQERMQNDWVMGQGASSPSTAAASALMGRVAELYVKDYVAAWQLALARVGLTRWTSFDGLQSVLQTLIGPNRPLDRILTLVKTNTDLPKPADAAAAAQQSITASLTDRATRAVNSVLDGTPAAQAVGLPLPDPWPGDLIRLPFVDLVRLVDAPQGQQPEIARIDDQISAVYAVINQIASNEDPGEAALKYVSAEQRNQATDAASVLRANAATKPQPIKAVMLQVANAVAGSISGGARQRIGSIWRGEVALDCSSTIAGRYPFARDGRDEVTLKDFSDFFRAGGTVDAFAKRSAPAGGVTPASAGGVSSGVASQIATAARIRSQFFPSGSPDPSVKYTITALNLDPGLARATITIDGQTLTFRHDPPRPIAFAWPAAPDAQGARITLRDFKSDTVLFEQKGPWAVFRVLDAIGLQATAKSDTFTFSVAVNGMKATFQLVAASSSNPFSLADLRGFRCSDGY